MSMVTHFRTVRTEIYFVGTCTRMESCYLEMLHFKSVSTSLKKEKV